MASSNDNGSSPMHLGLTGQFSPEDIQELLGVMGDSEHHHHQHHGNEDSSNDNGMSQAASFAQAGNSLQHERSTGTTTSSSASVGQTTSTTGQAATLSSHVPGEEAKAQARSERKRSREKQRRSDVNKQFADLTQLLQKIDAEDVNDENAKNGTSSSNRVTFNPSNRVDLIARTIILLERLHDVNKRRKVEIGSLQQQLDEAKKAGEDTAAKLKEALLAPPGQPMNKQFMMMVPMMMSSDGSGTAPAVPMMNPYMPQAAMPQAFCPMPSHAMATPVAAAAPATASTAAAPSGPSQAPAAAAAPAAAGSQAATGTMMASPQTMGGAQASQGQPQPGQQQQPQVAGPQPAFSYMMQAPMAGGGYMMPMAAAPGQPMAMVAHPQSMHALQSQDSQNGRQEQKDASPVLNGGSGNLAHCA